MLPWKARISHPSLLPGAPEFSPGERNGVRSRGKGRHFCMSFPLREPVSWARVPWGRSGLSSPSLSRREVMREAGFDSPCPLSLSLNLSLVSLSSSSQAQSREKEHVAQEAQCPPITPILQRSRRVSETQVTCPRPRSYFVVEADRISWLLDSLSALPRPMGLLSPLHFSLKKKNLKINTCTVF